MTAAWFEDRKMEMKNKVKHLCPKLLWQLFMILALCVIYYMVDQLVLS
jgi:hypothetical protein